MILRGFPLKLNKVTYETPFWIFPFCICFVFLIFSAAHANLSLSPIIIEQNAYPGGMKTFTISLSNKGQVPLDCTLDVHAIELRGGGLPVAVEDAPRSCKDWISLKPDEFQLPPGGGKKIVCHMKTPPDVGGGYYAAIVSKGTPPKGSTGSVQQGVQAGIRLSYSVMAAVLVTVPAPDMRAIVDAAQPVIKKKEQGSGYNFLVPVRNRGNIHARMSGTLEIRSQAGQIVDRFELQSGRGFLLPDHERVFRNKGKLNLPDGFYEARVRLETKKFRQPMRKTFPFYIDQGQVAFGQADKRLKEEIEKRSAGFTVSPTQSIVALRPGGRRSQGIQLMNMSDQTLHIQARVLEWVRDKGGKDLVTSKAPQHARSGTELVSLRRDKLELRPRSRRRIPVMLQLPRDATGEHYAAVCFDRTDISLDDSPKARAARSALLGIEAQGTGRLGANIVDLAAKRQPSGIVDFRLNLKNTGTVGIAPQAVFTLKDELGNTVGKIRSQGRPPLVQAGGEFVIHKEWREILEPGDYEVVVSLRYSDDQPPLAARDSFTVPDKTNIAFID